MIIFAHKKSLKVIINTNKHGIYFSMDQYYLFNTNPYFSAMKHFKEFFMSHM